MEISDPSILPDPSEPDFIWRNSDPFNTKICAIEASLKSIGTQRSLVPNLMCAIHHLKSGSNRLAVEALSNPPADGQLALYFYQLIVIGNTRLGRLVEAWEAKLWTILLGGDDFGYNYLT